MGLILQVQGALVSLDAGSDLWGKSGRKSSDTFHGCIKVLSVDVRKMSEINRLFKMRSFTMGLRNYETKHTRFACSLP